MSNMLRGKQGNLSKVKYFLPNYRQPPNPQIHQQQPRRALENHRKRSSTNLHTRSVDEHAQISFEIVGISETPPVARNQLANKENIGIKEATIGRNCSTDKKRHAPKASKAPQNNIEASLTSIRALTNSRQWMIPEGAEREQFLKFIETLKSDDSYQRTITMFTILYFYEKKQAK